MSFLVVAVGHSGTKFLANQLSRAPGWRVCHEPDTKVHPALVSNRFYGRYGEVNSWLLYAARHIPADKKAVLLRNPYDILRSVVRDKESELCSLLEASISYVRESMAVAHGLILDGYPFFRFSEITTSKWAIISASKQLGINNLTIDLVDLEPVNEHCGPEPVLDLSDPIREELNLYCYEYGL